MADKYIIGLYQDLEREVIADIARRVKKTGRFTETAELMAKSMHEQGFSPAKIQAEVMKMLRADKKLEMEIAENTKAYKQEIKALIAELVAEAKKSGNVLIAEAGEMAWNDDMQMWGEHGVSLKESNTLSQLITAFQIQTVNELKNLTRTTGFKGTLMGTTGVLNMYQKEMDLALLKVASGTFSYDQAVNDCVHRLAQSGLRTIDYENNRTYQLDTAVRMSVRTGMSQLAGRVTEMNLQATGQDLVITSQHMGSRPEHAVWQNKVFSYSGKSKKYPSLAEGTGYGRADGLKGVNCMHSFYPFWEGASIIPKDIKEPAPVTVNGKVYTYFDATQKQRKMERDIRATKREIEAQEAIGGDTEELRARLRKQNAEYRKFSDAVGLKPKANRLKVASGTSDLKKKVKKTSANVREGAQKMKADFVPAKTVEEAQKYAESLGTKYAVYDKLPLDTANELNKAISNLPKDARPIFVGDSKTLEQYYGGAGYKLPRKSTQFYGVTLEDMDGMHLGYGNGFDFDTHGSMVGISTSYKSIDKISKHKTEYQATYQAKYGKDAFYNVSGKATIHHEMGHCYQNKYGLPDGFEQDAERWAKETGCKILEKPSEAFSEAWGAYYSGTKEIPDYIEKYIKDIEQKHFLKQPLENTGKSVTMKLQADINKMLTPYEKKVLDAVPKKEGFFDFAAHGEANIIQYGSRDKELTAREVARIIKHNESYHGEKVRLLSCSTGSTEDGFAQQLANALGVEVEAPSDVLIVAPNGNYKIGYDGSGEMIIFKPNGRE